MKTLIILGAIAICTGAYAQTRPPVEKKEVSTFQSDVKEQADKMQKDAQEFINQKKDETSQKVIQQVPKGSELIEEAKDLIDTQDKEEMVQEKISEGNAAAAKAKAETVKTEAEAEEMIATSKEATQKSISSIEEKMVAARMKLTEKLEAKEITQAVFDEKMAKLMEFEKRKSSIINSMK